MRQVAISSVLAVTIAILGFFATGVFACDEAHPDRDALIGRWAWIHSIDFVGGTALTPDSEGYTEEWLLNSDGSFEILENGVAVDSGTWCLRACERNEFVVYCNDQTVLYFERGEVHQRFGSLQYDYWFCPQTNCAPINVGYERAMQVNALAMDAYLMTFEWVAGVPEEPDSWGVLKARYSDH